MSKFVNIIKSGVVSSAIIDGINTTASLGSLSTITTDKGHVLIGLNIANTHATQNTTVDVAIVDTSATPHAVLAYIGKNVVVPPGGNVELVDGKIVLDVSTQQLRAKKGSDGSADIIVSVLENA